MNEYLKLVEDAQKKRINLTREQQNRILKLYKDIAKELEKSIKKANPKSLNERWLIDYQKQFKKYIKDLNKTLKKDIESSMLKSAEYATGIQTDFFNLMDIRYGLNAKASFTNMFSKIPQESLKELISGEFYKDGKGLSKRLWFNEKKANGEFDYVIQKGLAEKRSVYDIASDLAKYVNTSVKKDWDFKKIYPNVGNKKIEYNSTRLAVTSISHAYQLSMKRSCKANPYVEGIQWHTSNSHRDPCQICLGREGIIYPPDKLPLDHPWGVCYFTPVIEKSLDDIGSELHNWLHGGSNSKLDNWYKNVVGNTDNNLINKKELEKIQDYKEPLAKRHMLGSITNKSIAKDKNTIIMPSIDVKKDIEDIKNGLYNKVNDTYVINSRTYGYHDSRFYPIEGDGFITLDRAQYRALQYLIKNGNDDRAIMIFRNMKIPEDKINEVMEIWKERGK